MVEENRPRIHVDRASPSSRRISNVQFGRRLYGLILERGWNQSELARQAGIPRDSVSTYIRGRSYPNADSLKRLADALRIPVAELDTRDPADGESTAKDPSFQITSSGAGNGYVWLRVNRQVRMTTATKIANLLLEDEEPLEGSSVEP